MKFDYGVTCGCGQQPVHLTNDSEFHPSLKKGNFKVPPTDNVVQQWQWTGGYIEAKLDMLGGTILIKKEPGGIRIIHEHEKDKKQENVGWLPRQ